MARDSAWSGCSSSPTSPRVSAWRRRSSASKVAARRATTTTFICRSGDSRLDPTQFLILCRGTCQVLRHHSGIIAECQFVRMNALVVTNARNSSLERGEFSGNSSSARYLLIAALRSEPGCELLDQPLLCPPMCMNVLAREITDILLESIARLVEHHAPLCLLRAESESFCAKENSKLQGHIEARQVRTWIELGSGNVMNAIAALCYDL